MYEKLLRNCRLAATLSVASTVLMGVLAGHVRTMDTEMTMLRVELNDSIRARKVMYQELFNAQERETVRVNKRLSTIQLQRNEDVENTAMGLHLLFAFSIGIGIIAALK